MIAHSIFFYTFSIIAIVSAIMVTASKNTVHSVFFLILDFISISCLFIMIGAEFLGMIMLIVYVGAVAVLFCCCNDVKCCSTKKSVVFIGRKFKTYSCRPDNKHSYIVELIIVVGGWKYKPDLLT